MKLSGKTWAVSIIVVILCVIIQCFGVITAPDFNNLPICGDDSGILQEVYRASQGLGLTAATMSVGDLANPQYRYEDNLAPGPKLVLLAQTKLGCSRLVAYKTTWTMAVVLGALGWMLLGATQLRTTCLFLFGFFLAVHQLTGFVKLGDLMLWAVLPYYFLTLLRVVDDVKGRTWLNWLLAVSSASLGIFVWLGAIYIAAAGAVSIVAFSVASLRLRFRTAVLFAAILIGLHTAEKMVGEFVAGAGHPWWEEYWLRGLFLHQLKIDQLLGMTEPFFGDYLGTNPLIALLLAGCRNLFLGSGIPTLISYLVPGLMVLGAIEIIRNRWLGPPHVRYVAIVIVHLVTLFLLLLAFTTVFAYRSHPSYTLFHETSRYTKHLVPAIAIGWFCILSRLMHSWGCGFKELLAKFSSAGLLTCVAGGLVITFQSQIMVLVRNDAVRLPPDPGSEFVIEHVTERPKCHHFVFDPYYIPYLIDGRIHNSFPRFPGQYRHMQNSGEVYVFLVKRQISAYHPGWVPDTLRQADFMKDSQRLVQGLALRQLAILLN